MHALIHIAVLTLTIVVLAKALPGVRVKSTGAAISTAVVFSLLNFFVGWILKVAVGTVLFLPAILTFGLLFIAIPFIVNTILLWGTDKLIEDFEITDTGSLLLSAGAITVANAILHRGLL